MSALLIRLARKSELAAIAAVFAHARDVMRASGNPNQWKDTYPSDQVLLEDMEQARLYVLVSPQDDGDVIEGVFVFFVGEEPTYRRIDGGWLDGDAPYGVIHRVASAGRIRGIVPLIVSYCSEIISNLRIDTHADNRIMQHSLEKLGFSRCGVITLASGDLRLAYQRL